MGFGDRLNAGHLGGENLKDNAQVSSLANVKMVPPGSLFPRGQRKHRHGVLHFILVSAQMSYRQRGLPIHAT